MSLFILHEDVNVRVPDVVQADSDAAVAEFMEQYQEGPEALAIFMEQYDPQEPPEVMEDTDDENAAELNEAEEPTDEGDDAI